MRANQLQSDREGTSIAPNQILQMWMTVVWMGQTAGLLAVAPGFIPTACTDFLGSYSLWGYLAQPRYSRKGLEPFSKQCVLDEWMGGEVGGKVE